MKPNAALLLLAAGSCVTRPEPDAAAAPAVAPPEMRTSLREVCENLNRVVQEASERIARRAPDLERKRLAVQWKIHALAATRRALLDPNPYGAFLDIWAMTAQRQRLLEREGDALLGDLAPVAREANSGLLAYVEGVAAKVFPPDALGPTKAEVEAFAAAHPIAGATRRWLVETGEASRGESILRVVTKFAPTLGLKHTAASIEDVSRAIDGIGEVVGDLPLLARWNLTLLLYEMNEDPTVVRLREDMHDVSGSVARFVEVADGLPGRIREEVSRTLDEVEAGQDGLRKTLGEARAAAQETRAAAETLKAAVQEAAATVGAAERATEAFARAGERWRPVAETLLEITGPASKEPSPGGPDPNLENLVRAAQEAGATADRLRAALQEMRALLEGTAMDKLDENARATVDHSTGRLHDLVDHAAWRAVQFAVAVALLALAYRLVALLIPRR